MLKKKNNALELWRFIIAVSLGFVHCNLFAWILPGNLTTEIPILMGGVSIEFFYVLGGYFMMKAFISKRERAGGVISDSPAKQAWDFTKKRYKQLIVPIIAGPLFGFIVTIIRTKLPITQWWRLLISHIWEFTGLAQTGVAGEIWNFDAFNASFWYLSAILVGGLFIYYLMARNLDSFIGFWAPLLCLIYYSGVGMSSDGINTPIIFMYIPMRLFAGVGGLSLGCLLYYPLEHCRKLKFNKKGRVFLTVANVVLSLYILFKFATVVQYHDTILSLFIVALTFILVINQDGLSHLIDNKFSGFLGKLALNYYIMHYPLIFLLKESFPSLGYYQFLGVFFLCALAASLALYVIDTYVITALFRNKKNPFIEEEMAVS